MEEREAPTPLPFFEKPLRVMEMADVLWRVAQQECLPENEKHRHRGLAYRSL
jgi:hypothetical protein